MSTLPLPVIPSRASAPDCEPDTRSATELADAATDALGYYFMRRGLNERDLRLMWLREAVNLIERAIVLEEGKPSAPKFVGGDAA